MDLSSPPTKTPRAAAETTPPTPKKTIVVWDVPASINKRKTLLDHFTQFGDVERLTCSLKSKYAIIMFNKAEEAELARRTGNVIEGQKVQIFFTQKTPMGTGAKRRTPSTSTSSSSSTPVARPPQLDRSAFGPFQTKYALRNKTETKHTGPSFTKMRTPEIDKEIAITSSRSLQIMDKNISITTMATGESSGGGRTISVTSTTPKVSSASSSSRSSDSVLALPSTSRSKSPSKLTDTNLDILSLYPDSTDAAELFGKKAFSAEDRYKILEARDKILRARIPKVKMRVELAAKLFGTCPDMCPEKERYMREFQRQLTPYEIQLNQDQEVDHQRAIKVYSRSSADQEEPLPHELRPGSTLEMTMNYILHNIISRGEKDEEILADWYNFVWDRTRSIRKDITQQQLCNSQAVSLMEKCTRFHIHCSSRLCELDRFSFDTKLNDENLMKCLQSLEHLYSDLRLKNMECPNEPEFRSYQILMNLNEGDILWEIQQKPDFILKSPPVQQALKIHHAVSSNNFVAFFRLVRQLPYLTSCIVHRYFFQVRSAALRTLVRSHSANQKFDSWASGAMIKRMLGYGDDDHTPFMSFCLAHGVNADQDSDRIIISRRSFYLPEAPSIYREAHLIESKLTVPIAESINGGPLAPNPYPAHVPQCSFDEEGYLIPGPIISTNPRPQSAKSSPLSLTTSVKSSVALPSSFSAIAASSITTVDKFDKPFFSFTPPTPTPTPIPIIQTPPHAEVSASATIVLPFAPDPRIIEKQRRKKVEDISAKMAPILFRDYQDDLITNVLQDFYLKAYDENLRIKTMTKNLTQQLSVAYSDKLRDDVVDSLLKAIVNREISSIRSQLECSEQFVDSIVSSTVAETIYKICDAELMKHINANRLIAKRASELYGRIKLRGWIRTWRQFTEKKRTERKQLEESRRKLIRDFPAGNQYGKTAAEVLASWCGPNSITDRLVSNVASFINDTLHVSSSEDEDSSSSSDESVEECNDDFKNDTVSCSYEEFLECYPGIETVLNQYNDKVEDGEKSEKAVRVREEERTESAISSESVLSRKRTLSPVENIMCSPPLKIACQGKDTKLTKRAHKDSVRNLNGGKLVVDVDVLCEDIKSLVSKSKIERYLWDTDMSVLDSSIEFYQDELKGHQSFHEEIDRAYNKLNETV